MKTFKSKFLGLNFSACNKDDNETTENNTETSRDAFYGQDADYLKGEEMAYKDNGGETITDLIIGLMWIQDDNGEGILWQELQCYAEAKDFAGHSVPKIGDPTEYEDGHSPQDDAIRIYNYVRLVKDAETGVGLNEIYTKKFIKR